MDERDLEMELGDAMYQLRKAQEMLEDAKATLISIERQTREIITQICDYKNELNHYE